MDSTQENLCLCDEGWKGKSCESCVPYWNCPNKGTDACLFPNECHCTPNQNDPLGICFHADLDKSDITAAIVKPDAKISEDSCGLTFCEIETTIKITDGYQFSDNLLDPNSTEYQDLSGKLIKEVGSGSQMVILL